MDYSDGVNAISSEWEKLLENNIEEYMIDALRLKTDDTSRKIVNGKPQKAVQLHALKSSINNNADPNKKGLSYLAMRSIHYWKTMYEREMKNPTEKTEGKYCSKDYFRSLLYSEQAEYDKLQNIIDKGNLISKEQYETLEKECYEWRRKYEKLDANYNKDIERERDNAKKSADAECERIQRIADFYKNECQKLGKINSNKEH